MPYKYTAPASELISVGIASIDMVNDPNKSWINYIEVFGFTSADINELTKMACDGSFSNEPDNSKEVWAPIHARRALGQLKAVSAIPALLALQSDKYDEWVTEDFPRAFGMIGPQALPALSTFLDDIQKPYQARVVALEGVQAVAKKHQDFRGEAIEIVVKCLKEYAVNSEIVNGFAVSALLDMKAVEAIDIIREAYNSKNVDESICGDLEDVEIELGLRSTRLTTAPEFFPFPTSSSELKAALKSRLGGLLNRKPIIDNPKIPDRAPASQQKVGRNDPCPCGSGRKYKKCCLN